MMWQWFGGMYKDDRPENLFPRLAVEPEKIFTLRGEMKLPDEQKIAFQKERTAALIGKGLADKLNLHIGDRITLKGDIFPINLELIVRAIFESDENNEVLYFSRKYLDESVGNRLKGNVGMFMVLADSPESVPRIVTPRPSRSAPFSSGSSTPWAT
jgi:putative ABC transport system permease protein